MCEHWETMLPDYVANTLHQSDKLQLEQHLTDCISCQKTLSEWMQLATAVRKQAHHKATSLPVLNLQSHFQHKYAKHVLYIEQLATIQEETDMSTKALSHPKMRRKTYQPQGLSWTFAAAITLLILLGGLLLRGQLQPSQSPPALSGKQQSDPVTNIYEIIDADENLSLFAEAVESSNWAKDVLANRDGITVFVPTNDALTPLFSSYDDIQNHYEELVFLHLMDGVWDQEALVAADGERIQSQWQGSSNYGNTIMPELTNDNTLILNRHAQIIESDIVATNGIIHIIDTTISPPEELLPINFEEPTVMDILANDGRFTLFLTLVASNPDMHSLLYADSPVTVFVPLDTALQPLLDEIDDPNLRTSILYAHVVRGIWTTERFSTDNRIPRTVWDVDGNTHITSMRVTLDTSGTLVVNDQGWIIGTSIYASNGVINVVDSPLFELPE